MRKIMATLALASVAGLGAAACSDNETSGGQRPQPAAAPPQVSPTGSGPDEFDTGIINPWDTNRRGHVPLSVGESFTLPSALGAAGDATFTLTGLRPNPPCDPETASYGENPDNIMALDFRVKTGNDPETKDWLTELFAAPTFKELSPDGVSREPPGRGYLIGCLADVGTDPWSFGQNQAYEVTLETGVSQPQGATLIFQNVNHEYYGGPAGWEITY
ncbi:hypothetical protein [Prauserella endophytica]|uniref:Lipoprotein n=1 Tax=Prauserella endophytica TaxID=1592324 RepID=A0ABY2RW31_9PSEU|nr:hypothetical protein [Prauserella endophytica]TKG62885.1 hypothetical protein FCN18_31265 [Prauserella endophytica]